MTREYDVGYRKPPKHTQFKKGASGNPKGRPPGSKKSDNTNIFCDLLIKKTTVSDNGKKIKISLAEAYYRRVLADAINGKPHAVRLVQDMINKNKSLQEKFNPARSPAEIVYETIRDILDSANGKTAGLPKFSPSDFEPKPDEK